MTDLSATIKKIDAVADQVGLAEFAREAGVPYTTAADWKARGWRPKVIETLEKFAAAADRREVPQVAGGSEAPSEAA